MKILLIGEYSNVHASLAKALRSLGHEVLVMSDGDGWKNYPRDIDISRRTDTKWETLQLMTKLTLLLPRLRGWDIVHIINPYFVYLNPDRNLWLWNYLKRHNGKMSVGLYGDDYQVLATQDKVLDYCDTWDGQRAVATDYNATRIRLWTETRRQLCERVTDEADFLIAGLYEYWMSYNTPSYKERLHYIGYPIEAADMTPKTIHHPVRVMIGIQKKRLQIKGTDQMLPLLRRLSDEYPDDIQLTEVENVPFAQYQQLLKETDVLVDQLYSYTPAMNALEAMKNGTIVISGGEEPFYQFIGEQKLRPIINLRPGEEERNYTILRNTLLNQDLLTKMSHESQAFVREHHDATSIAKQYIRLWS